MDAIGDDDLSRALRDFVERVGAFDPISGCEVVAEIELRAGAAQTTFVLTSGLAKALAAALDGYHDPRDCGRCDNCGGARLDDNLICVDCGWANGIFGRLLMERAARYDGDPAPVEGEPGTRSGSV